MSDEREAPAAARRGRLPSTERPSTLADVLYRRKSAERILELVRSPEARAAKDRAMPKRVVDELGFVLHTYPWSESSLLVDALTVHYGRVFLIAKGAKRPSSLVRGLLTPFAPLRFAWSGRNEAKVLVKADWMGTMTPPTGEALLSGFYMNELVLRLTEREDRHEGLFELYASTLAALSDEDKTARSARLRRFEKGLLTILGWGPNVANVAGRGALSRTERYVVSDGALHVEGSLPPEALSPKAGRYTAEAVAALLADDFSTPAKVRSARDILRELIQFHLGPRTMHTRRILGELTRL